MLPLQTECGAERSDAMHRAGRKPSKQTIAASGWHTSWRSRYDRRRGRVATRAVELLVKVFGFAFGAGERSDDKTRIGLALGKLSLGNNPPFPAPTTARLVPEILEAPRRLLGPPAPRLGA